MIKCKPLVAGDEVAAAAALAQKQEMELEVVEVAAAAAAEATKAAADAMEAAAAAHGLELAYVAASHADSIERLNEVGPGRFLPTRHRHVYDPSLS